MFDQPGVSEAVLSQAIIANSLLMLDSVDARIIAPSPTGASFMARFRRCRTQGIELVELRVQTIVVRQSSGAFHLTDDWIKCAFHMLRRAKIAQVVLAGRWRGVPAVPP